MSAKAAVAKAKALRAVRELAAKEKKAPAAAKAKMTASSKLSAFGDWAPFEELTAMEDQQWPARAIPSTTRKFYDLTGDDQDVYLSNIVRVVKGEDAWHYVKRVALVRCDYGGWTNVWRHATVLLPMRKKRNSWRVERKDLSAGWSRWSWSKDKGGKPVFEWHINEHAREAPIAGKKQSLKVYGAEVRRKDDDCISEAPTQASQSDCQSIGSSAASQSYCQSIGSPVVSVAFSATQTVAANAKIEATKKPAAAFLVVQLATGRVKAFAEKERLAYRKECAAAPSLAVPADVPPAEFHELRKALADLNLKEPAWVH